MPGKRKTHTAAFKAQVALAAVKCDRSINELAADYGANPNLILAWKKQLLAEAEAVFAGGAKAARLEKSLLLEYPKAACAGAPGLPAHGPVRAR